MSLFFLALLSQSASGDTDPTPTPSVNSDPILYLSFHSESGVCPADRDVRVCLESTDSFTIRVSTHLQLLTQVSGNDDIGQCYVNGGTIMNGLCAIPVPFSNLTDVDIRNEFGVFKRDSTTPPLAPSFLIAPASYPALSYPNIDSVPSIAAVVDCRGQQDDLVIRFAWKRVSGGPCVILASGKKVCVQETAGSNNNLYIDQDNSTLPDNSLYWSIVCPRNSSQYAFPSRSPSPTRSPSVSRSQIRDDLKSSGGSGMTMAISSALISIAAVALVAGSIFWVVQRVRPTDGVPLASREVPSESSGLTQGGATQSQYVW